MYLWGTILGFAAGVWALFFGFLPFSGRFNTEGIWVRIAGICFLAGAVLPFLVEFFDYDLNSTYLNRYVIRAIGYSFGIFASLIAAVRSFKDVS